MAAATLRVPGRSLEDWLREISDEKRTGRLSLSLGDEAHDLYFVGGDLYVAPEHRAFAVAQAWLSEYRRPAPADETGQQHPENPRHDTGVSEFRQLAGPLIGLPGTASDIDCTFISGASQIRLDLAGPLPTTQLLMESAVWRQDEQGLLRRLGGEETRLRSCHDQPDGLTGVGLEPHEAFLLSRLDPPATVNDLVNQLDVERIQVLRSLTRLLALGLVVRVKDGQSDNGAGQPKERLVSRFEQSIGESLASEPLGIGPEQHRELLGNLLTRMGEMTYFEILAVTVQSSEQEVHQAYFELGRLVHPSHAENLGLKGKEGAFRVLFERATDAYLTLSDVDRRLAYLKKLGPSTQGLSGGPSAEQRDREKQEMARQHYERALALADRQDFHSAIQLLEQAVKVDPQTEYLTLLGDCQSENPQWLDRATLSYKRALQIRPGDPSIHVRLGRAYERLGRKERARQAYEEALEIAPQMEAARSGLWRLGAGPPTAEKPSLTARLRRFFGR